MEYYPRPAPDVEVEQLSGFFIAVGVSIAVEVCRAYLHPEIYNLVPYPKTLAVSAVVLNAATYIWNPPNWPRIKLKAGVTGLIGQAGLPPLMLILLKFGEDITSAFVRALYTLTAPMGPH